MFDTQTAEPVPEHRGPKHRLRGLPRNRWVRAMIVAALSLSIALVIVAQYVASHAAPLLKQRVISTLEDRFHSPVELDELDVSVMRGLEVHGRGLRILNLAGPNEPDAVQLSGGPTHAPMLSVADFTFRTSLGDLVRLRTRIARVYLHGLEVHIPPHAGGRLMAQQPAKKTHTLDLEVGKLLCSDAHLVIETTKPGKQPLTIDIRNLELTDVGTNAPFVYVADLINPKPVGTVHAFGHFGPWQGADPRSTPLDGVYRFEDADLSTIKGISGTLSSTGSFTGQMGKIAIDGTASVPNFALDVSGHPEPLLTQFHAIVDGTTGDTTLAPVHARLQNSSFTCSGPIVKVAGRGHDIQLNVNMPHGRIEDLLGLGMKTEPPLLRGDVSMQETLHILPGPERVAQRMQMQGHLNIQGVEFTNTHFQDRVDGLSMRAQGRPEDAKAASTDSRAEVASRMAVTFSLNRGLMTVPAVEYDIPGAEVQMAGVYSTDGNLFEFKGVVRTQAKASQMLTGWKSMLARPFDRFLQKNGAGVQLPISVSGTKGDIHFGLAMHDADETPAQMAADLKARRHAQAAPKGNP